jgi:hypothetical protein
MNYRCLLSLIITSLLAGCDSDDPFPGYVFKDQNLQGTIEDRLWVFQTGSAEVAEDMLQIILYDLEITIFNACLPTGGVTSVVFSVPKQTGLYKLANLVSGSPVTVTYFSAERQLNFITADGAIEISTLTETGLTGRMDINWLVYEGEYEGGDINGNFVIPICQ